jgi:hypothetical protein
LLREPPYIKVEIVQGLAWGLDPEWCGHLVALMRIA